MRFWKCKFMVSQFIIDTKDKSTEYIRNLLKFGTFGRIKNNQELIIEININNGIR